MYRIRYQNFESDVIAMIEDYKMAVAFCEEIVRKDFFGVQIEDHRGLIIRRFKNPRSGYGEEWQGDDHAALFSGGPNVRS